MGATLTFARNSEELETELAEGTPALAIVDLTSGGVDHVALLDRLDEAGVPVLGYTTHAAARETQPLHGRCSRVVTRETLTRELPSILKEGIAA